MTKKTYKLSRLEEPRLHRKILSNLMPDDGTAEPDVAAFSPGPVQGGEQTVEDGTNVLDTGLEPG